ncbi:MAG: zinc ribbon domain-containing protein [Actinomycetota bacterium]|nr:zinc ribbon domain-containing protein [Actinomycetota bacterium]
MLVCPNCRNENLEDANFCRVCGRSLEALGSPMLRRERTEGEEPDDELPSAPATSPWPTVVLVVVVGLGLAAWGLFRATAPNPCAGKYSSAYFSYCAEIPRGWTGGSQLSAEQDLDQFVPEAQQAEAATFVRIQEVLDPAIQTPQYVQQFRVSQEADGLDPSRTEIVMLDGEEALAWNYALPGADGEPPLQLREVVVVRTEGAWRITLVATDDSYPDARIAFEEMLASWSWKS